MSRIDVELEFKFNRNDLKSILFHDGDKDVWLPKSQIAIHDNGRPVKSMYLGQCVTVNLPEWLAKEKGII